MLIHGAQLEDLEKLIDPFLSGDPRLVFRHVLTTVMDKDVPAIDESRKFAKPVNRKEYPQYYKMIKEPISIEEVRGVFFYKKKTIFNNRNPIRPRPSYLSHVIEQAALRRNTLKVIRK